MPEEWTDEEDVLTSHSEYIEFLTFDEFEKLEAPIDDIFQDGTLQRKVVEAGLGPYPSVGCTVKYRCIMVLEDLTPIHNSFFSPTKARVGLSIFFLIAYI